MSLYKSILLLASRFFLLTLYAIFFMVQFFFNFKSDNFQVQSLNSYQQSANREAKHVFTPKSSNSKNPGFRLNKRFQPAIVPDLVCSAKEIPVKYLNLNKANKPDDYLLISFILATSLRGPPALSQLPA